VTGRVAHFSLHAVVAGTAPADIRMSDISVSPSQVVPGGDVRISVQLVNQGDLPGNYSISLSVNDIVVDTLTVQDLEGGATAVPEFTVSRSIEGTYTVDIGGLKTSFTVTKDPVPDPEPTVEPTPDTTTPGPVTPTATPEVPEVSQPKNWTWLLGVIGGANVVVLILILIFTRRRA
jgi:hypothetical protein